MRGADRDTDREAVDAEDSDRTFESELEELVLRAFGEGEDVEGVWDLKYAPEEIPDWTVTIDRKDGI
ncbi:hypothetical protein M0R89_00395 [Halorussus limi]|uniref:Uncharacterized protein n=1 Tax=Halorussus limi TaxID=2938695 RepID=A0A8U0HV86_9EURY|nr:hypothetical protein [Halorussus limi]UPV74544.1 hypothetical protein M0R89_00395 [Halorussus limi]